MSDAIFEVIYKGVSVTPDSGAGAVGSGVGGFGAVGSGVGGFGAAVSVVPAPLSASTAAGIASFWPLARATTNGDSVRRVLEDPESR